MRSLFGAGRHISFHALWTHANTALGFVAEDHHTPCYRLADRFLQRHRRAGNITKAMRGGQWQWVLTEKGETAFAKEAA
jgi:hypothetical protein